MLVTVYGQNCSSYALLQNGRTLTWTDYTKRGDVNGSIVSKTSGVIQKGNMLTATVKTEVFDKRNKSVNTTLSYVKCEAGVLMMDMRFYLPEQQREQFNRPGAQARNVFIDYPLNMKVGDALKGGTFEINLDNNGVKQRLEMIISDRRVSGKESITLQAGTWDCFIISYQVKLNIQTGPVAIPLIFEASEWYAPSFGIVKTAHKSGVTELLSVK